MLPSQTVPKKPNPDKAAHIQNDPTRARLVTCFQDVFPALAADVIAHASTRTVKEWDSIATATLVAVVEEAFSVTLDLSDPDRLASFDGILAQLQQANG